MKVNLIYNGQSLADLTLCGDISLKLDCRHGMVIYVLITFKRSLQINFPEMLHNCRNNCHGKYKIKGNYKVIILMKAKWFSMYTVGSISIIDSKNYVHFPQLNNELSFIIMLAASN